MESAHRSTLKESTSREIVEDLFLSLRGMVAAAGLLLLPSLVHLDSFRDFKKFGNRMRLDPPVA